MEMNGKNDGGILGRAEVFFGGKIYVNAVRVDTEDGIYGLTFSEFYEKGEAGTNNTSGKHEPQLYMFFNDIRSVEVMERALATIREEFKRHAESQGDNGGKDNNTAPEDDGSREVLIEKELYDRLSYLGIIPNDVRSHNAGNSDYSKRLIQPWSIWLEYGLNAWDADIVKRVLRTKDGEPRRLDYEKIIHICNERIRQIDKEQQLIS